jgi:hypothetical protein
MKQCGAIPSFEFVILIPRLEEKNPRGMDAEG